MKRLSISIYILAVLSVIFTLVHVSFRGDISLAALPLAAAVTALYVWCGIFQLLKKTDAARVNLFRKICEYLPFIFLAAFVLRRAGIQGTSHLFDLVSVILWVLVAVADRVVLYLTKEKRLYAQVPAFEESRKQQGIVPVKGIRKVLRELFEWVDAFLQAAFMVSLIQIFIIQLYEIPSESMVPEFLVGDRVIVFKTASGPRFPLSDVGLPNMRSYGRGDIIVFRNPHYSRDRQSEVRTFVSQLVYMLSFTLVNLNVDENGQPKADPLVKRVTGVAGEQLVMVDGILYKRTEAQPEFTPVDEAGWAAWNLNEVPPAIKTGIQDIPLTQNDYDIMTAVELERSALNLAEAAREAQALSAEFAAVSASLRRNLGLSAGSTGLPSSGLFTASEQSVRTLFMANDEVTRRLLTADGGAEWFERFMTGWIGEMENYSADLYADSMFRLNILIKLTMGHLVVRNTQLMAEGISASRQSQDITKMHYLSKAQDLDFYLYLNDRRNMPVFPAEGFIPENNFFMMGDNRFNSLDMRHSYEYKQAPVSRLDPSPVYYMTNMEPQYVPSSDILGTTVLRFWPVNRMGIPR
ncbi:MAG: signal peptidase I [Spirochaetaceae bacterium]|jgi:signal peptidase I|nr:signal peptidase I [Spirochaetaceae bacterium]